MVNPDTLFSADEPDSDEDETKPCVMSFNANDASGAAGLGADVLAISCVGAHALPVIRSEERRVGKEC